MEISALITIGRLGKSIDKNGFITFKPEKIFQPSFLTNVFLLFTDNRVRYVTVTETDQQKGFKIKIDDAEVVLEAAIDGRVQVKLSKEDIGNLLKSRKIKCFTGMNIIFEKKDIGKVVDVFNNSAYDVLVVELDSGKELMIPKVDYYVERINKESIFVKNIEGLLKL
ncbi:MAG: hypothetical protein KAU01_02430 [Candidatus Cloacimonetes bacterium]|nr:hypothetical protein [Candidatus Cloacimonadota bacterium]